jgi:hypothetical protein
MPFRCFQSSPRAFAKERPAKPSAKPAQPPAFYLPISHRNPGSGTAYKVILSMGDQSNATSAEESRTNHYSISQHEVCCFCQTVSNET